MRVAILNHGIFPQLVGGMERHTHFLAAHLSAAGAEVEVVIPELPPQLAEEENRFDRSYGLVQMPWPEARLWLRSNYLFSQFAAGHVEKGHFDAVYCQGFNGWAYLKSAAGRGGPLTLFNPHGLEMFKTVGPEHTAKSYPMRWAARQQARFANRVVSLGGRLTEETVRFLRVAPERIDVLPNAVDLAYIDGFAGAPAPHGDTRFIFVGRIEANKGVDNLCEAFATVGQGHLTIVGSGALERELKARFAGPQINFAGRLSEATMFRLYRESDCFVFASLYEGMPTVILEAMACRLPVIATEIGAVATMVGPDNGFVVPPGSAPALAGAMRRFLDTSAPVRCQMAEASRRKVENRFVWPVVAAQTLKTIDRHLAMKAVPSRTRMAS